MNKFPRCFGRSKHVRGVTSFPQNFLPGKLPPITPPPPPRSRGCSYFSRWDELKSRDCFLARARMHGERRRRVVGGKGEGVMGRTEVELDGIFAPGVFPNSRSYGIGSHKSRSTRALAREGTRRGSFIPALTLSAPAFPGSAAATYMVKPCSSATAPDIFSRFSSCRLLSRVTSSRSLFLRLCFSHLCATRRRNPT